jgi:sodium-independent sulfate anion transporter 11
MATPTSTKIGHGLAKVLGINLHYRDPQGKNDLTRGDSVFSVSSADTFVEEEPTVWEWIREVTPGPHWIIQYFIELFPFVQWIKRYNLTWLSGDLIAGMNDRSPI